MGAAPRIGFLGMGIMGSRMARNLAQKGFSVTVWNRTRARAEPLAAHGAQVASTPAEVAGGVEMICTCVADPQALREVAFGAQGVFSAVRAGQLLIDFSTVSPELARELGAACEGRGMDFVEAPVTGSKTGADKGTLLVMVGASDAAFARAQPVFQPSTADRSAQAARSSSPETR